MKSKYTHRSRRTTGYQVKHIINVLYLPNFNCFVIRVDSLCTTWRIFRSPLSECTVQPCVHRAHSVFVRKWPNNRQEYEHITSLTPRSDVAISEVCSLKDAFAFISRLSVFLRCVPHNDAFPPIPPQLYFLAGFEVPLPHSEPIKSQETLECTFPAWCHQRLELVPSCILFLMVFEWADTSVMACFICDLFNLFATGRGCRLTKGNRTLGIMFVTNQRQCWCA